MEIARLIATYEADTSNFEAGNRRVQSGLDKTESSAKSASQAISNFGSKSNSAKDGLDKTKSGADSASNSVSNFGTRLEAAGTIMSTLGQGLQSLGSSLTSSLTAPIAAATSLGIKFNATKEQSLMAFKVLLKDGDAAKKLFSELQNFADKTPFESPEVVNSAKMLKAYGFEVGELIPLLTDAGNLASGMGFSFEDVSRAFGRLKAGDFGDAFERFRDFGITAEQLASEGLEFDKKGAFTGSAKQAIEAVRNIIKRDFGGMMEEQSGTFSGQMSTLWDKVNSTFGKITEPLFNAISRVLPYVIGFIELISEGFTSLSPVSQILVGVFAAVAAAIGPILTVVGTLFVAIGGIVGAVVTVGASLMTLTGAATVGAAISAAFAAAAPILVVVGAAIAQIVVIAGAAVAVAGAIYAAWVTNFGNIQGFVSVFRSQVSEAFNGIVRVVQPAIDAVKNYAVQGFAKISQWWNTDGKIIQQAASQVFANIIRSVQDVLNTISAFWQAHGPKITSIVTNIWNGVKAIISGAVSVIGGIIKLIAQVINGDWQGAWETAKTIVSDAITAILTYQAEMGMAAVKLGIAFVDNLINTMTFGLAGSDLAGKFTTWIDSATSTVESQIGPSFQGINASLNTELTNTKNIVDTANSSANLGGWWDNINKSFTEGANNTLPVVKQSGQQLKDTLQQLANNTNLSPELRKRLNAEFKRISETVSTETKQIGAKSKDVQGALNKLLANPNISQELRNAIQKELKGIENKLSEAANPIKKNADQVGQSFNTGISEGILNKKELTFKAQETVVTNSTIPVTASEQGNLIGGNISTGIAGGIRNNSGVVNGAIKDVVNSSIAEAKRELGIQSPSKVFIAIGKQIVEGAAFGVLTNAPLAVKAVKRMAAELIQSGREELGKAFANYHALKDEKLLAIKVKLFGAEQMTSELTELIRLKLELGEKKFTIPDSPIGISDQLKETRKKRESKELADGAPKTLQQMRENAEFEVNFPDATELQRFLNTLTQGGVDLNQFNGDIEKTAAALSKLAEGKALKAQSEAEKSGLQSLWNTIKQINPGEIDPLTEKLEAFAETMKLKDVVKAGELDATTAYFAATVKGFVNEFNTLAKDGLDTSAVREKMAVFLSSFKTAAGDGSIQTFSDKMIPEIIDQLFNLDQAVSGDTLEKGLNKLDGIFEKLKLNVGGFKAPTELEKFTKSLSDPEVTAAIAKRAAEYGMTAEKLKEIMLLKMKSDSGLETLNGIFQKLNLNIGSFSAQTNLEEITKSLSDPEVTAAIAERAEKLGITADKLKEIILLTAKKGADAEIKNNKNSAADQEPKSLWGTITDSFSDGLEKAQASAATLKGTLTEVFQNLPQRAGGILTNALTNWDGTFKGFFKSVAKGFGELITEIINQLLRMIVVQAIMSVLSASFGGDKTGSWGSRFSTSFMGGLGIKGKAEGGLIKGRGTKTSDSILSWLSNGEFVIRADAVEKYGVGFFASLNNMRMPALASGGMVGNDMFDSMYIPTFSNNRTENNRIVNNNPIININASRSDSLATPKSRRQTAEAMTSALRKYNG